MLCGSRQILVTGFVQNSHNMGCMAPIGLLLHEADVAGMSIDCSRAGLALLLAFLHAIGRPGWVMRSKNAIGFIPRCKLQLPLMPRHLHQPRLLHQVRPTVRATVRAACRQNVMLAKARLHAHSADRCTTERWAHDAAQTMRLAPHAFRSHHGTQWHSQHCLGGDAPAEQAVGARSAHSSSCIQESWAGLCPAGCFAD